MLINRKWVKIVRVQENTDNWEAGSMTLAFYQTLGKELLALEVLWSPAGLLCWPPTKVNYLTSRDTGRRLCSSWWPEHIETSQNKDQKDSPLWKIMFLVTQLLKIGPVSSYSQYLSIMWSFHEAFHELRVLRIQTVPSNPTYKHCLQLGPSSEYTNLLIDMSKL